MTENQGKRNNPMESEKETPEKKAEREKRNAALDKLMGSEVRL
jgi:hypothetical protein